ncbi:hypothetical protein KC850_01675 [Candidatus Kaiserbacteria bacterium]|nr:hypothetical protein [Candidatus Kaiserbacteria bacterium]MCB9818307.1 hypothetical protein [Candidatus Nomurabacteria bacterium]
MEATSRHPKGDPRRILTLLKGDNTKKIDADEYLFGHYDLETSRRMSNIFVNKGFLAITFKGTRKRLFFFVSKYRLSRKAKEPILIGHFIEDIDLKRWPLLGMSFLQERGERIKFTGGKLPSHIESIDFLTDRETEAVTERLAKLQATNPRHYQTLRSMMKTLSR